MGSEIRSAIDFYERHPISAEIIKASVKTGRSIRDLVKAEGLLDDADLDRALDVLALTRGGLTT